MALEKSRRLIDQGFDTSSGTTPEFLGFYRTFKSEFKKMATEIGCRDLEFSKGHFEVSGFMKCDERNKGQQVYYFHVSDVRFFPDQDILIRTARDYGDYSGGQNQSITWKNPKEELKRVLGKREDENEYYNY